MNRTTDRDRILIVERGLGYSFQNSDLLLEALTHKSFYHENRQDGNCHNERLEFLGDSVIGLVVVEYLFLHQDAYTESVLAKVKSYIVSEPVFAERAEALSLGSCVLLGKGERSTGGRAKKSILSNTFEAVIGAVFLDGGFETARTIVRALIADRIESAISSGEFLDYKTELQEKCQLLYGVLPEYRVIGEKGEEHRREFSIAVYVNGREYGTGTGARKKEAESRAAREALSRIP